MIMDEVLNKLINLARNGNNEASDMAEYLETISPEEFPLWLVENDVKLRDLLGVDYDLERNQQKDVDFLKQYSTDLIQGKKVFSGDKIYDVRGKEMKSLDDFMNAFGVSEINDDARSFFTNPNNKKYWGNRTKEDVALASIVLGYKNVDDMTNDLTRASADYQRRNQVEGWGENNEFQPLDFSISALKGFFTPRIKEAQLEGRKITWQDVVGDLAENGLQFVPGIGIVKKATGVIVKGLKVKKPIVESFVALSEQFGTPFATQAIDAGLLYNPDVLGSEDSANNYRKTFDFDRAIAQGSAAAMTKGVIAGSGNFLKDVYETKFGADVGGDMFGKAKRTFENIGQTTDDIITRRQIALDRKAAMAGKKKNVQLKEGVFKYSTAKPDDMFVAEHYRILNNETNRLAKAKRVREEYDNYVGDEEGKKKLLKKLKSINETGAEDIYQLPDGRLIRASLVKDGKIHFPEADYSIDLPEGSKILNYDYEGAVNARDYVVGEKIKSDNLLFKKMNNPSLRNKEMAVNTLGSFVSKYAGREGLVGDADKLRDAREQAIRNKILKKVRVFVANPELSPEQRIINSELIMNIMAYGTDVRKLPDYEQNKILYDAIIKVMQER